MNKRRTLNHSIIYILGSSLQALIPFLIIPSLTRNVSQSSFGLLMVMISLATVMSFIVSFGIPIVLTRELVFDKLNSSTYKDLASKIQSVLLWVSIIIILLIITGGFSEKLEIFLFSFSVASSLAIVQIQLSILRAEFKAKSYAFLAISSTGIPLLVTNFFSLYGSRDLLLPFATSPALSAADA